MSAENRMGSWNIAGLRNTLQVAEHSTQDVLDDVTLVNRKRRAYIETELYTHKEDIHGEKSARFMRVRNTTSAQTFRKQFPGKSTWAYNALTVEVAFAVPKSASEVAQANSRSTAQC